MIRLPLLLEGTEKHPYNREFCSKDVPNAAEMFQAFRTRICAFTCERGSNLQKREHNKLQGSRRRRWLSMLLVRCLGDSRGFRGGAQYATKLATLIATASLLSRLSSTVFARPVLCTPELYTIEQPMLAGLAGNIALHRRSAATVFPGWLPALHSPTVFVSSCPSRLQHHAKAPHPATVRDHSSSPRRWVRR